LGSELLRNEQKSRDTGKYSHYHAHQPTIHNILP
jgi:hypothetical protein